MAMLDQVRNTRDMEITVMRGMSYGRTGVGKTYFAATFPRPLFLSAYTEGGIVTLRKKDVDYIDIYSSEEMLSTIQELHALAEQGRLRERWDTIVFDSITLYCEQYIQELVEQVPGKKKMMRRPDWGQLDTHLRTLTVLAHELPVNVWWIALEDEEKEEDGSLRNSYPMLFGKRSVKILASMDVVLWHEKINTKAGQEDIYRCHSSPFLNHDAKDRFGELPARIDKPSYGKLAKAIGLQQP